MVTALLVSSRESTQYKKYGMNVLAGYEGHEQKT